VSATFAFSSAWEVPAPPASVHAVLLDLEHYPDWWPQVVAVASLGPDHARVLCRSVLPYTLDLVLHAVDRSPGRLVVDLAGDLAGTVVFGLTATDAGTRLDFTQEVEVRRGWLGVASYVGRPALRWNHERMMRGCRDGLWTQLSMEDMSP
jgi:polyketide cyclase/dehydrase/lipid transport protein